MRSRYGMPPSEVRVSRLLRGHDELLVFSWALPARGGLQFEHGLSASELEIVKCICEGLSNKAIAERRGTSLRTVANQVASVFRKMNVGSRAKLISALAGTELGE